MTEPAQKVTLVTAEDPMTEDVPRAALSAALDSWQAACMANATNEEAMRRTLAAAFRAVRPERPDPDITDGDIAAAAGRAVDRIGDDQGTTPRMMLVVQASLASAYRPGGIVARAIADELERMADVLDKALDPYASRLELRCAAANWREGKR